MSRPTLWEPSAEDRRLMTTFGVWLIFLAFLAWGVR